jgi:P22 coat protein - gene protein 5
MPNSFTATFPDVFSKTLLRNFDKATVMGQLVSREYEGDIKNAGDVVNAVLFGNVTVSDYTPGSDVAVQNLSLSQYALSIDQKKAFNAIIDLVEITQSHLDLVNGWMQRASVALAEAVDDRLLSHHADIATGNTIGTNGAPITLTASNVYDYFVDAAKLLDKAGLPQEERYAVIDEETKALILKSPSYVRATNYGDEVIRTGSVGQIAGFDVRMSPRIPTVSGVKNMLFMHRSCISLAFQIPPEHIKTYEPEKQFGTGIKGLALYGSKVFQNTAGVVLKKAP